MTAALLEARDLRVGYGSMPVLQGLDIQLAAGEIVGMFGHNGAGKSTLLRTLAGLKRPAAGRISFTGDDVTESTAAARARRGMALVPDSARGVFPNLTVEQNLALASLAHHGKLAENVAVLAGLFPAVLANKPKALAGQLSGGERQMVAISIALARRPRVLLLDEPSLGLAPRVVESLMSAVATVARQFGASVLIVEQNIPATLVVADRIVILKHGKLVADMRAADCPPAAQLWDYF
jgi:branched-chain amino acid transport system ATP-binding protein